MGWVEPVHAETWHDTFYQYRIPVTLRSDATGWHEAPITAKEVAAYGITCNAVCPGLIDTEMVQANVSPERLQRYLESFPIPRIGKPEEVAELVAFLASDRSAYITGASLDINGGDLMVCEGVD